MEQLDLLWDLESQWNSLYAYRKKLVDLKEDSSGKATKRKVVALEKGLLSSKLKQEKTRQRLAELEKELKMNNFNVEELEKGLYDGQTTDVKQLEYLNREKEKIRELINNMETEVLELMGKLEDYDKEIISSEKELGDINANESEVKAKYESLIKNSDAKIEGMEKKIKLSEEKIDEELLTDFNRVKKSRGSGIVELKDSICMGCNIMIPTFSMEKIRTTKGIFRCESCGRILYHKE